MVSPRYATTMENLPGEVLSEIFIRLLAKQLAQMRCVCKSWNALLSESFFVKSHLHYSIHNNNRILLFFNRGSKFSFDCSSFTAHPFRSPYTKLANFIKLPVNSQSKYNYGSVIGSVNGLICFYYKSYDDDYLIRIWNPSLSAVLTLQPCSLPYQIVHFGFGFGFDPKTEDYKVVKLTRFFPHDMVTEVEVYSMRKGSWELLSHQFPNMKVLGGQNQVFVNGHLHWLGATDLGWKPNMIVAFDLGAETFSEIPLPDSILHLYSYHRRNVLGVLAGKLCLMSMVRDFRWEIWVMDKSWAKHHVFPEFSGDITPYGFTSHNEFVFRFNDDLDCFSLYDPIAVKTKILFKATSRKSYTTKFIEYVDSLVWIAPANRLEI